MEKLFYREYDNRLNQEYLKQLSEQITVDNVLNYSYAKIAKLYQRAYEKEFLYFRFDILYKWFCMNQSLDRYFLESLKHMIKILGLKNFLNVNEQNYLNTLKSYVFTINRNIKSLIVDFPLNKDEMIYFHYNNIFLATIENKKVVPIEWALDIFFGNQRFVFTGHLEISSFNLDDINKIIFNDEFIIIKTTHKDFVITGSDIKIIEVSIKRLYKIIGKDEVWTNL